MFWFIERNCQYVYNSRRSLNKILYSSDSKSVKLIENCVRCNLLMDLTKGEVCNVLIHREKFLLQWKLFKVRI